MTWRSGGMLLLVKVVLVAAEGCTAGNARRRPVPSEPAKDSAPDESGETLLKAWMEDLVGKAVEIAKERGLSLDGLDPVVTEQKTLWNVAFTGPGERRKSGGKGFVIRFAKKGETPPEIFKCQ